MILEKRFDSFKQQCTLIGGHPPHQVCRSFTIKELLEVEDMDAYYDSLIAGMQQEYDEKLRGKFRGGNGGGPTAA